MKRAILIVAGPVLLLLVLLALTWTMRRNASAFLSQPPSHGVCFTIEIADSTGGRPGDPAALRSAVQRRFAQFGSRIFWEPVSPTQFKVYAPIQETNAVEAGSSLVSQPGVLQLRFVHTNSSDLIEKEISPEGYQLLKVKRQNPLNRERYENYVVQKAAEGGPAGIQISSATTMKNSNTADYDILFTLTPPSAETFKKVTRENIGRQLAIVVDDILLSAPVIRSEIAQGSGVISGTFSREKAAQIASLMQTPLPAKVNLLEIKTF